jgi:hypothetical protein
VVIEKGFSFAPAFRVRDFGLGKRAREGIRQFIENIED